MFQHLVLDHEQTAEIIAGGHANMVCFTGSVAGGKAMEEASAGRFINVGLELGGKDPAYVRPDANMAHAIENLVDGAFFNSGQSCCGIERIYVHKKVWYDFLDGFVDLTKKYVLGSPLDQETTLGPMVRAEAAAFVRKQIASAVRAGAKAHIDPKSFPMDKAGTPYMAPQVLTSVTHRMSVMMDESFGPVVGIMKVSGDEEALELMNDSPYGLTAAIWTQDVDAARAIGDEIADRHGVHEPLRLSRSGAHLDRGQGHRPRRDALEGGLRGADPAQELSPENQDMTIPSRNLNYPTAIKFGAGRIRELADHCKANGITRPLFVTDPGLAAMPMVGKVVDDVKRAGLGIAVFSDVRSNPVEANVIAGVRAYQAGDHDGVVAFGGGSGLDVGKLVALMHGQRVSAVRAGGRGRLVDEGRRLEDRPDHRRPDHGGHRLGSGPRRRRHPSGDPREEDHLPSGDHAQGGDPRSGADRRPAAQADGSDRDGCDGPLSSSRIARPSITPWRRVSRSKACGW